MTDIEQALGADAEDLLRHSCEMIPAAAATDVRSPRQRRPHPNHCRFRLGGKEDGVMVSLQAKPPGEETVSVPVTLGFTYDAVFGGEGMEAYERLLTDVLAGQATLFARQDGVEEAWRVVDPLLTSPPSVQQYEPGSWGPAEAASVLAPGEAWHSPGEGP